MIFPVTVVEVMSDNRKDYVSILIIDKHFIYIWVSRFFSFSYFYFSPKNPGKERHIEIGPNISDIVLHNIYNKYVKNGRKTLAIMRETRKKFREGVGGPTFILSLPGRRGEV